MDRLRMRTRIRFKRRDKYASPLTSSSSSLLLLPFFLFFFADYLFYSQDRSSSVTDINESGTWVTRGIVPSYLLFSLLLLFPSFPIFPPLPPFTYSFLLLFLLLFSSITAKGEGDGTVVHPPKRDRGKGEKKPKRVQDLIANFNNQSGDTNDKSDKLKIEAAEFGNSYMDEVGTSKHKLGLQDELTAIYRKGNNKPPSSL